MGGGHVRIVYTAGPIRAGTTWLREANIRRAEYWALRIWQTGKAAALCPHAMSRSYCEKDAPFEVWMAGDLEMLRRCDAVYMLPGWPHSQGARMERDEAVARGIPVFEEWTELLRWLGT